MGGWVGGVIYLALGSVHHVDDVVGLNGSLNLLHFLKQGFFLLVPPRSVDDNHFVALGAELAHAFVSDADGVCFGVGAVERDTQLGGVLLELVESTSVGGWVGKWVEEKEEAVWLSYCGNMGG